ncbi:MAG: TAXI family TRAP transporter solute-binding subunit, partial [candidate division Zixibacteria bacterium]|nr:TAXI family TRAP transporter solute-binding subunit [candidate division Zixibacteria bacterium]
MSKLTSIIVIVSVLCIIAVAVFIQFTPDIFAVQSPQESSSSMSRPCYRIATGGKGGIYYSVGEDIASLAPTGIQFEVKPTSGSPQNIDLIKKGEVEFAIVQNDIARKNFDGSYKVIASLYTEPVQICVRAGLRLDGPRDLRGKRISLNEVNSGTYENAKNVLEASGITLDEIAPCNLTSDASLKALEEGTIDAAFFTAGVPHDGISKMLEQRKAYLLGLDAYTIKTLVDEQPYPDRVLAEIPKNSYPNMKNGIATVGVTACLICSQDSVKNNAVIFNLMGRMYSKDFKDSAATPVLQTLEIANGIDGFPKDSASLGRLFHPEAVRYFHRNGVFLRRNFSELLNNFYPGALLVILFAVLYISRRKRAKLFSKSAFLRNFGKVLVAILVFLIPTGVILFYMERDVNNAFSSFGESIWSIMVYLVSGFEDRAPLTNMGKVISVFGILSGAILASFFTGVMAAVQMKGLFMKDDRLGEAFHDHVVILGWNEKGRRIISEILKWNREVAVMSECESDIIRNGLVQYAHRIACIKGNPRLTENLRRLRFNTAHSVLILSNRDGGSRSDDFTVNILLQVHNLISSMGLPCGKPHVVVEVNDPASKEIMILAGADEVVCTADLGQSLLINCAVHPGVSRFYEDLLTISDDTNEVYDADVPTGFVGKSYKLLREAMEQQCDENDPIILVGLKKGDGVICAN